MRVNSTEASLDTISNHSASDAICLQCGDIGFTDAFVYCVKCLKFAVHRYCLYEIPRSVNEFTRWICDDCDEEVQNQPIQAFECKIEGNPRVEHPDFEDVRNVKQASDIDKTIIMGKKRATRETFGVAESSHIHEEKKKPVKKIKLEGTIEKKKKHNNKKENKDSDFSTACRPAQLCNLVAGLTDDQKADVQSIGFGGLLHVSSLSYIPWKFVTWFVNNFNPSSRVLKVGGYKDFVITAEDICDVFLLPLNDKPVQKNDDDSSAISFLAEFKEKHMIGPYISFQDFKTKMMQLTTGREDFKRMFVLFALCTFLTPCANRLIDFSIVRSLQNVNEINRVDWCSYVLARLCRAMSNFKNKYCNSVNGCIIVLPLLYFHRLKWQGYAEPSTLPLIQHWTSKKIKDRLIAESSADHIGQGEWICDTYPVSSRRIVSKMEGIDDAHGSREVKIINDNQFVNFQLPPNEKSDFEIAQLAKDPMDEALLLFKRNLTLVIDSYVQKMKNLNRKSQDKETCNSPSPTPTVVAAATAATSSAAATTNSAPVHAPAPLKCCDEEFFSSEEFLKAIDNIKLEFTEKEKLKRKQKKKYFDYDD